MGFNPFKAIGSFLDDVTLQGQYGPGYKKRAAFLQRMQAAEEAQKERAARADADEQGMRRWERVSKIATPLAAGAEFGQEQVPGQDPLLNLETGAELPGPPVPTTRDTIRLPGADQDFGPDSDLIRGVGTGLARERKRQQDLEQGRFDLAETTAERRHQEALARIGETARANDIRASGSGRLRSGGKVYGDNGEAYMVMYDSQGNSTLQPLGNVRGAPPTPGERGSRVALEGLQGKIARLREIAKTDPTAFGLGPGFQSRMTTSNSPWDQAAGKLMEQLGGRVNPNAVEVQNLTSRGLAEHVKAISGAQVSEREAERLSRSIPNPMQDPATFLQQLQTWENDLANAMRAFSVSGGGLGGEVPMQGSGVPPAGGAGPKQGRTSRGTPYEVLD